MKLLGTFISLFVLLFPTVFAGNCFLGRPVETGLQILRNGTGSCDDFASDFKERDANQTPKFYNCSPNENSNWGPWGYLYPKARMPPQCDETTWAKKRVLAAIDYLIKKGWNYCHHHDPYWVPPANTPNITFRSSDICSESGFPGGKIDLNSTLGWQGIDCSHFSMYVYNFAFGSFFSTGIGSQACNSSVLKPLNYTIDDINKFQPGDFIYLGNKEEITHVVLWTGLKVNDTVNGVKLTLDLVLKNHVNGSAEARYAETCVNREVKKGNSVYLVADSHANGPNYRLFAGWHKESFRNVRRLINAEKETAGYPPNFKFNYNSSDYSCYTSKVNTTNTTRRFLLEYLDE